MGGTAKGEDDALQRASFRLGARPSASSDSYPERFPARLGRRTLLEAKSSRSVIYVAAVKGRPVGWAAAIGQADIWWLDDLWIAPDWMGKGIGSRLFTHAAEQGRAAGARRMEWEAEPNALGFYERMGGRYLRDSEPGVWGRVNAVMGLDLS
jgi:GNAT superfamily N-acetyltransferase